MMKENFLPIGSVVRLKGGEKKLMICGRIACKSGSDEIYDYVGCRVPEGVVGTDMLFFNKENIEEYFFIGFQDKEELQFEEMLDELGELEVVDGQIVPKREA